MKMFWSREGKAVFYAHGLRVEAFGSGPLGWGLRVGVAGCRVGKTWQNKDLPWLKDDWSNAHLSCPCLFLLWLFLLSQFVFRTKTCFVQIFYYLEKDHKKPFSLRNICAHKWSARIICIRQLCSFIFNRWKSWLLRIRSNQIDELRFL